MEHVVEKDYKISINYSERQILKITLKVEIHHIINYLG